jgi:hypothetical protein
MIVTSKRAIKRQWNLPHFFSTSLISFNFHHCHYTSYLTCHINSSHFRTNAVNFSSISEDTNRQHLLQANTWIVMEETQDCSHYGNGAGINRSGPVPVTSNILAQERRRNGTETWRRPSCRCEHLRLITHEKSLVKGDVPRRNGAETWRRLSCRCEHLRLITHEKILVKGDFPRWNGNVTCSVNQP